MPTQDHDTDDRLGVTCDECNQTVTLRRKPSGLLVGCGCDDRRAIRVATVLPEGWQP